MWMTLGVEDRGGFAQVSRAGRGCDQRRSECRVGKVVMRGLVLIACAGCASLLPKKNPFPDEIIISPGIKASYTFGKGGGLTWGGEITMPFKHGDDLHAIVAAGPALNLTWSPSTFQARLGVELVSWFAGV